MRRPSMQYSATLWPMRRAQIGEPHIASRVCLEGNKAHMAMTSVKHVHGNGYLWLAPEILLGFHDIKSPALCIRKKKHPERMSASRNLRKRSGEKFGHDLTFHTKPRTDRLRASVSVGTPLAISYPSSSSKQKDVTNSSLGTNSSQAGRGVLARLQRSILRRVSGHKSSSSEESDSDTEAFSGSAVARLMALPKALKMPPRDHPEDIFALAVIAYELLTLTSPWRFQRKAGSSSSIKKRRKLRRKVIHTVCVGVRQSIFTEQYATDLAPPRYWKLVRQCWRQSPQSRPRAPKVLSILKRMLSDIEKKQAIEKNQLSNLKVTALLGT